MSIALSDPWSRRDLLRLGLPATLLLATGLGLGRLAGCSPTSSTVAAGFRVLRVRDLPLWSALTPALLGRGLTDADLARALQGADTLLGRTHPDLLAQLNQLLDGLQLAPVRRYLTGQWQPLDTLPPETLAQALTHWSRARGELARTALRGLSQPVLWAWYLSPAGQRQCGYPGPPRRTQA